MRVGFVHPELLILALPLGYAWWTFRGRARTTAALRLLVAVLLLLALAGPYLRTSASGRDLVIAIDRSASMPPGGEAAALELVRLAEEARTAGDRVAVVGFAGSARSERLPSESARFDGFVSPATGDGTDLAAALETALSLIPDGRRGSVLVVSDGESNGRDPLPAARRAFARGIAVDTRAVTRPPGADTSVESLELPGEVDAGEPFQLAAWIRADAPLRARWVLERRGERISSGEEDFPAGRTRLLFRDRVPAAGVADYRLTLQDAGDPVPENDVGLGAVLVRGARPLLLLNHDGAEDSLARALALSGIPVDVRAPESALLDPVGLSAYRAVVLENVAAGRLGLAGMEALADFVLERGGGLLLSGGRASFGVGGYHLSPLDPVLPVSMELRQEHRKQAVAIAIALDTSGSMTAPAAGGTKMDLANAGTASAIELLSPIDAVAVLAVDSAAKVVQELVQVEDPRAIGERVRRIQAGGGGIYTYTALVAAGSVLEPAEQKNRHVILFADAADAEEPDGCVELVGRWAELGTSLSVIALGTESDQDAAFLKRLAEVGGGEAHFTSTPEELPRLFAMDTVIAARSAFVEEATATEALPDLVGLGGLALAPDAFPALDGYNLTYVRPDATLGVRTKDESRAPAFAFARRGLGRSAAFTGQIGGTFGAPLVAWEGFTGFFVTLARWLGGEEEPSALFPSVKRAGRDALWSVEIDPEAPVQPDTSALAVRVRRPDGRIEELVLERESEQRFEARHALTAGGVTLGTVVLGDGRFVTLPPVALAHSPEFEHRADPRAGERLLRALAEETGGLSEPAATDLFRGERTSTGWRLVAFELMIAALVLFLLEVAGRRLHLWATLSELRTRRAEHAADRALERETRRARGHADPRATPSPAPTAAPEPEPPARQDGEDLAAALDRARRRAERRLER